MPLNTEKNGIKLSRLTKDLSTLFLPIIRYRGKKYAKEGRVQLTHVSDKFIKSRIRGSVFYKVSIDLEEKERGAVRIGCTCPFFRQGIPCKHIWATIVAAEQYFKENQALTQGQGLAAMELHEIFKPQEWVQAPDGQWNPVQDFVLRYELEVNNEITLISAFEQYVKKDGSLGRQRKIQMKTLTSRDLPREDRLILPFLLATAQETNFGFNHLAFDSYRNNFKEIPLSPENTATLLPLLAETGRCVVKGPDRQVVADPLLPANSKRAKLTIGAEQDASGQLFELRPQILIDDSTVPPQDTLLINSSPVMLVYEGRLYELAGPSFRWIKNMMEKGLPKAERHHIPDLVKHAIKVSRVEHLELPKGLAPETVQGATPVPGLILKAEQDGLRARAFFLYDSLRAEVSSHDEVLFDEPNWRLIKRNEQEERKALETIRSFGLSQVGNGLFFMDYDTALDALPKLEKHGVVLEAEDGKSFKTGTVKRLFISSGIDWFDMDIQVAFGNETLPLPKVISSYLNGQKTVRLASGGRGILPTKWLEKHRRLLELAKNQQTKDGKEVLRFPSSHALMVENLLADAEEAKTDRNFEKFRQRLSSFKGISPLKAPAGFKGTLRPYQEEALGWFDFLYKLGLNGILADDMGLGKTVQVLAWLQKIKRRKGFRPNLIVAPTSLVFNWQAEAEKFTPRLKMTVYVGQSRKEQIENFADSDIVLTTYGIIRRDIGRLVKTQFNYCILDESQYIKNPDSLTAKACRLIKARHKLCLTGTPIENHLGELWSQMEFLNPGILGRKDQYMERFAKPAANGNSEVLETLKKLVAPFILRRTKEEVAKELPDKIESIVRCTMTKEQTELYNKIRDHYRASIMQAVESKGIKRTKMMVLEGLLRLRQAANHPALLGAEDCTSGKFQQLVELLAESIDGGHKVLIFSQFTKMLGLIRRELDNMGITYEYLDGRTPQAKREERVRSFQEDDSIRAFLISLRAGGFGLNLTAADYVFIVDPWWNPAVELQAIDRTHRIGQTKKVVTYRLISKDSVEEKVLGLQEKKQKIVYSILSGSRNLLTNLTAKDLEILFS
ncbi:MAG: DEAD/DEAH box helicase family protein [Thermodesulfobacteria bacterium]|nr:DEAD/DEAH box helicase family protein [Thermodesulfobacteriota bacterium]